MIRGLASLAGLLAIFLMLATLGAQFAEPNTTGLTEAESR